ncbi:GH92 family glycosyl hydrolase [Sphingomonas nostoxanthinifaciens]|uniref:GH92 family glycosyl hydrolase n=1 Tax=Sphingomonas nostoxanthinifaciens TaxID=2872652 RepID=UPI001CC1F777|nr:GH92 family glycosyl hydrolase [Sphingomonas nostoxanthinifaciens]UAK23967.1 GH92 family glycosyl hydrolase [Sphingomonas nostoxanthinifaciens]
MSKRIVAAAGFALLAPSLIAAPPPVADPAARVNVFVGTTNRGPGVVNGGNVFPGAVLPFGMASFSPVETPLPGKAMPVPGAGGYEWRANGIQGFSLTHVSGTGCAGTNGDIPFMPITGGVSMSPAAVEAATRYASLFAHADEHASPGAYDVALDNGVKVELGATLRTSVGRLTWPKDKRAALLIRTSDSAVGSNDAAITIDAAHRTVAGSVSSGNFCGTLAPDRRQSYYTLHFVAMFDRPFTVGGTWTDRVVTKGATSAHGGTTYGSEGAPPGDKGSGGWITFDAKDGAPVTVRIGISYVDEAGARANLAAEAPDGTTLETVRASAKAAWNDWLGRIRVAGGTDEQQAVFYTALYHALSAPNLNSDVDGRYRGFDKQAHPLSPGQHAQYVNYSGWDVYRGQVQLLTLLDPQLGSDFAQSLLNQADQNGGVWDRWTHITGATGVMNGDPSPQTLAAIRAFGGVRFDLKRAYASLLKAATVPTPGDLSKTGCPVLCVGQRPGLDRWLSLHYMPVGAPGWGGAADTLEMTAADFGLSELALQAGDRANAARMRARSGWWRNLYNPRATPEAGYIQPRNADGSWPKFDPADDDGFVEGSGAQYLWMVPFDPAGLFAAMGGRDAALKRLDGLFHDETGALAVTRAGDLHAEMANEPSIGAPWLYNFLGQPWQAQAALRETLVKLWDTRPDGLPGNDDLGTMSAWYVWSALGLYPLYPGRAELMLAGPLFDEAVVTRAGGKTITIRAAGAATDAPYVQGLTVNGRPHAASWLGPDFIAKGGTLDFTLGATPNKSWGVRDLPPSFGPKL